MAYGADPYNKYIPQATGIGSNADIDLSAYVRTRFEDKQYRWQQRATIIEEQQKNINSLLEINLTSEQRIYYSAKSVGQKFLSYYASVLPHKAFNFLLSTKLHADFVDFVPQRTMDVPKIRMQAQDLSDVHGLLRQHSNYEEEVRKSDVDLARYGEAYLFHNYIYNPEGECKGVDYKWISWRNVRGNYNSTDWIIVMDLTALEYVARYGKEMLSKVSFGGMLETPEKRESINYDKLTWQDRNEKIVQVIMYFDPAQKIYAEFHGSAPYQYKLQKGDDYPFMTTEMDPFVPIQRRKFYEPMNEWHGYGVIDLLVPLARTETNIINSTLHRAILAADPMTLIPSNNPADLERKYNQYLANRRAGQFTKPFFIPASAMGSHVMKPEIMDIGVNNNNFETWRNFVVDEATMRTGIDFRVMINYAPTADQARLRKQEQDRVNRALIQANAVVEKQFALQDIYMLKAKKNLFCDTKVYLKEWEENVETPGVDIDSMKDKFGNLPPRETTVGEVIDGLENLCFDVKPRLEGAFDDQTYQEVMNLKEDMLLAPPGSVAYVKIANEYFKKVHPQIGIQFEDFSKPAAQEVFGQQTPMGPDGQPATPMEMGGNKELMPMNQSAGLMKQMTNQVQQKVGAGGMANTLPKK